MLVRVMGEAAAYALVEQRGGMPFTVPNLLAGPAGLMLAEIVGPQAAAAMVCEMGGITLALPKNDSLLRQLRHRRVIELRGVGYRQCEVARATNYTTRQVINILNTAAMDALYDEPQGDLFAEPPPLKAASPAKPAYAPECGQAHNPFGLAGRTPPTHPAKVV